MLSRRQCTLVSFGGVSFDGVSFDGDRERERERERERDYITALYLACAGFAGGGPNQGALPERALRWPPPPSASMTMLVPARCSWSFRERMPRSAVERLEMAPFRIEVTVMGWARIKLE